MPNSKRPTSRIVILGGGYAGLCFAQRLSRRMQGLSVILVDAKADFQERIRLHQVATGQTFKVYTYRHLLGALNIQFLQARVTALFPDANLLTVHGVTGAVQTLSYDYLVYALGSAMDVATVPGVCEYAHALDCIVQADQTHAVLQQSPQAKVLVVGGGLTGIETATELAERLPQLNVTLAMDKPLCEEAVPGGFDKKATHYVYSALAQRQISLRTDALVVRLRAGAAELRNGQSIPFDTCIWTSGFMPSLLARSAGIQVNPRGQVITDRYLRSLSHPNIIAIGDAAQASSADAGVCRMGSATGLAMGTAGARTLLALLAGTPPPAFRFVYLFRNISLGRGDGVVQFVDRRDVPRSIIWTGMNAAVWKEYICQSTLSTIGLRASEKLPTLPPLRILLQLMQGMLQYA